MQTIKTTLQLRRAAYSRESDLYTPQYLATLLDNDLKLPAPAVLEELAKIGQAWPEMRVEFAANIDPMGRLEIQRA